MANRIRVRRGQRPNRANSTWHHNTLLTDSHTSRTCHPGQQSDILIHRNGSLSTHRTSVSSTNTTETREGTDCGPTTGDTPRLNIHSFPGNGDPCCTPPPPGGPGSNLTTDPGGDPPPPRISRRFPLDDAPPPPGAKS